MTGVMVMNDFMRSSKGSKSLGFQADRMVVSPRYLRQFTTALRQVL